MATYAQCLGHERLLANSSLSGSYNTTFSCRWVVPRHDGVRRLGIAQIDRLVWDVRRDEDEIAGLVDHRLSQSRAVPRLDASFEEVNSRLVTTVDVRLGRPAGGNHDEIDPQAGSPGRGAADAEKVRKLLPRIVSAEGRIATTVGALGPAFLDAEALRSGAEGACVMASLRIFIRRRGLGDAGARLRC